MKGNVAKLSKATPVFWLLAIFLVLVFMTGGTSRGDAQSLVILGPLSVLVCGVALATLRREHLHGHGLLFAGFALLLAFTALHLIPLPSGAWQNLPGREDIETIDRLTRLGETMRPIALTPQAGWQSFFSLFAPLAVLLLGLQLSREELYRLLPLVIGLGAISGLLGLLQIIGSTGGSLHFYRITNSDSAVGLFANRNHAAILLACLFPMLAVFASTGAANYEAQKGRQLIAMAIAIVLIPLILVTGSRAGLLLSLVGLLAATLLYQPPSQGQHARQKETIRSLPRIPMLAGIVVICLGLLTIYFSRAEAIERLFGQSAGADSRTAFWSEALTLFWKYFPFGSGAGTFVEPYKVIEQNQMLTTYYLNRAHNDWVEIAVMFGAPSLILLSFAVLSFGHRTVRVWGDRGKKRRSIIFARMAGIGIAMIAVASIADYPLRTPTLMCVFALLTLWFVEPAQVNSKLGQPELKN